MVKISSANKTFRQGWNDPLAAFDEKPGMLSTFSYDYWMDTTEITQKQFFEITGRRPVPDTASFGVGDRFPVYYVTWFDAVLFCNARSKADSLDTVYVYSDKKSLSNGNVYELTSVYSDLSRGGYRLPTEAEWEYAARGASSLVPFSSSADSAMATTSAWFLGNSDGTTHLVATKIPNSFGLYDMAGNVFEWTNDWKGLYDSLPLSDPLGAPSPGKESEKVIKGGGYNYNRAYLRPTRRSATYSTIPSTANEYVGFRCARAVIQHGQYLGMQYKNFIPNPVMLLEGRSALRAFLNTAEAKLVFVNVTGDHRTLCYVNFSDNFLSVREFTDDTDVYTPALSPNGRYVAYSSRNVGLWGPAKITVRRIDSLSSFRTLLAFDSAYIPRWWVNPSSGDTCIIFTNSSIVNNSPLWPSTKTFMQEMRDGLPSDVPIELAIEGGGYHDGISCNGRYAITANTRLIVKDFFVGLTQELFQPPFNGKDASGSKQVCNASIAPDPGNFVRCMFLDFGYPKTSSVTGCMYGIHQFIFVATLQDSITQYIRVPPDEQSWDNPQWSNRSGFAVSCARGTSDQAHSLYLINLEKNQCERVIEGVELQQPFLWIGSIIPNQSGLPLDSIGCYREPLNSGYQAQLGEKLILLWQRCDSLEVAIIGSSQATNGFDPSSISGLKSFNLSAAGGDLLGQKHFILNYLLLHCPQLKVICSSLDVGWLGNTDGDFSWKNGIGQSKGYCYDSSHGFWKNGVSSDFKAAMKALPTPLFGDTPELGFWGESSLCTGGWGDSVPSCAAIANPQAWTIHDSAAIQNIETIRMLADSSKRKGVHWIIINFPVSPHYKNTPYYSFWGPLWQTALDVEQKLTEIEKANPYFHYYNANMDGNHDYSDDDALDENHLCTGGAKKLAARVDSIIHKIIY